MSAPQSIVANFGCLFTMYGPLPGGNSPGPFSALLLSTSGPGCTLTARTNDSWLSIGSPAASDGFQAIPLSAAENTGVYRDASILQSNNTEYSLMQGSADSPTPGPASLAPSHGSGSGAIFALQAYDATDYTNIGELDLTLIGMDGAQCHAAMSSLSGTGSLYLVGDAGTFIGPLSLSGSGILQNSKCTLNAAGSSFSGSGKFVTANFNLTFTSTFSGSKYITGTATDGTGTNSETDVLGTWLVSSQPGAPMLSSPVNQNTSVSLLPALSWIPAAGATSYDVYLGTSATPPLVGTTGSPSYSPAGLNPGSTYYWQVVAKNGSGSVPSEVRSFTTAQTCAAPVTAASPYSVDVAGSGASVAVGAAEGCSWGYTSPVSWVTFQPSTGLGSGAGSVAFTVASNSSPSQRSTSITVAGVSLAIAQAGNTTCDVSGDNYPVVADAQTIVNEVLGVGSPVHDLNHDHSITVADVQIVVNAVLGRGCMASGN